MKLYVCWGTQEIAGHACGKAHSALKEAGYEPEVKRAYGWKALPEFLNQTPGRKEVKKLTGSITVPVLVTDDDQVIVESGPIIEWAKQHPAK